MRAALARATGAAHRRLHRHPWLGRLSEGDLSVGLYRAILSAYLTLHDSVEADRIAARAFDALSLGPACAALRSDLAALGGVRPAAADAVKPLLLAGRFEILGALYVLHGAGFGGRSLAPRVAERLPKAPRAFLQRGTAPELWRVLKRALEDEARRHTDAPAGMTTGAKATFAAVDRTVTAFCAPDLQSRSWPAEIGGQHPDLH